ncbi:hypothetical protein AMECASPLE_026980 [Ameca splendens]|uniref:Uncharacterized protein n=1 Tax=Ameca splendens TaxID=208324 RepID=A0ABV1ACG7_9TELE
MWAVLQQYQLISKAQEVVSWSLNENSTWKTHHPATSNHSSLAALINGRSALLLSQSSPRASLLKTLCMENTALLLSFDDQLRHVQLVSDDMAVPRTVCDEFRRPSSSSASRSV